MRVFHQLLAKCLGAILLGDDAALELRKRRAESRERRLFAREPLLELGRVLTPPLARGLMTVLSAQAFSDGPQPDWWLESLRANFARWARWSSSHEPARPKR